MAVHWKDSNCGSTSVRRQNGKAGEIEGSEDRYAPTEAACKKQEDGKKTNKQQLTCKNIQNYTCTLPLYLQFLYNALYFILYIL